MRERGGDPCRGMRRLVLFPSDHCGVNNTLCNARECCEHNSYFTSCVCVCVQLTTKVTGGEEGEMSRFRVTASPDGQSETQTVEVKVRASGEEDEDVKGAQTK